MSRWEKYVPGNDKSKAAETYPLSATCAQTAGERTLIPIHTLWNGLPEVGPVLLSFQRAAYVF